MSSRFACPIERSIYGLKPVIKSREHVDDDTEQSVGSALVPRWYGLNARTVDNGLSVMEESSFAGVELRAIVNVAIQS